MEHVYGILSIIISLVALFLSTISIKKVNNVKVKGNGNTTAGRDVNNG